jgi:hypothetical protein
VINYFLGVACINPPSPPAENNLVVKYVNNTVIPFGGKVSYVCADGYFFEEDYYMPYFNLTCLPDGNFSSPVPWKKCLNPQSKLRTSFLYYLLGYSFSQLCK